MKNKQLLLFTIIGIVLIIYGIFSRYIAIDAIYHLNRKETDITPEYEVITVSEDVEKLLFDMLTYYEFHFIHRPGEDKYRSVYDKCKQIFEREQNDVIPSFSMNTTISTLSTKQCLEELEQQKKNLEEQITEVNFKKPMMKPENIRNWLYRLRTLNPEKLEHRRVLVDTFVNKIFLYDDKIIFTFNYKSDSKEVTLKEIEVSDIFSGREPVKERQDKSPVSFLVSYGWTRKGG